MFAGAAFTDQADIESTDAVDTLVALGVIQGYTDGSFRPETTVTRAEMAKMIYTILNGGNDDASAYENLPTSFTDLTEDWYKGYVKYLQNSDIIAGTSATTFAPNETVTGVEAAKMMLVAAGYSPDKAGLTGLSWRVNTMKYANANSLFAGVNCDINSGLPRQYAAQILYNALDMENVVYSKDIDGFKPATDVSEDKTIGGKYMDLITYEGILTGSGDFGASKDKIEMGEIVKINGDATVRDDSGKLPNDTWDYEEDVTDLVGQYVKVQTGKNDKVYGVFAVASENTVVTTTFDKLDASKISEDKVEIDGTEYKLATGDDAFKAQFVDGTALTLTADMKKVASGDQITFISNDGDDKFDIAYVNPMQGTAADKIAKVTYVSDSQFVAGGTTYKFDEVIAPDDLEKDDYVVYNTDLFTGDKNFIKADEITGKITSTKDSAKEIKIDDTWYKVGNTTTDLPFDGALTKSGDAAKLDDTVTIQVINGVIYDLDIETAGSTDTAVVLAAPGSMDVDGNYQVKLLFADGSTKVVAADAAYDDLDKDLVTYEISDGVYELKLVQDVENADDDNLAGGDSVANGSYGFVKDSKSVNGQKVASDAVIYVGYQAKSSDKNLTYKVMTGADLNALSANFGDNTTYVLKDGLITIAYITEAKYLPGSNADQLYGYVVSDVLTNNDDGVEYLSYTVYTSEGETLTDVIQKDTKETVDKGDFIKFDLAADNNIENVDVLDEVETNVNALRNSGSDFIQLYKAVDGSNIINLDDDVKYLIVNTDETTGMGFEASDLDAASGTGTKDQYYGNVSYVLNDADEAVLVVCDGTGMWMQNDKAVVITVDGSDDEEEVTYTATVSGDPVVPSETVEIAIEGKASGLSTGDTVTVKVAKNDGAQFGAGTYTLTVEGADAPESQVIKADSTSEITFEVTVGTSDITVTGVTKA